MARKQKAESKTIQHALKYVGLSSKTFLTLLALLAATGGTYGGYVVSDVVRGTPFCATGAHGDTRGDTPSDCGEYAHVSRVLDGDTFDIGDGKNGASGEGVTVRLSNVAAPELDQCYGPQAAEKLANLVRGNRVRLYKDIQAMDEFGREVHFVHVRREARTESNVFVNEWLLRNGYAYYVSSENVDYARRLREAESQARAERLGLWGMCSDVERKAMGALGDVPLEPEDPACVIKGNVQDVGKKKVYFLPHCPNYKKTIISAGSEERYFCSEKQAEKAGFVKSEGCK